MIAFDEYKQKINACAITATTKRDSRTHEI